MKNNFKKILKEKGFYISLLTGALSIIAVAAICLNIFSGQNNSNLSDLNEPGTQNNQVAEQSKTDTTQSAENKTQTAKSGTDASALENDVTDTSGKVVKAPTDAELSTDDSKKTETTSKDAKKTADESKSVTVMGDKNQVTNLHFNQEKGLAWPVAGDVIMDYSMDKAIYFQTLAQYKCNPAIVISTAEGTKVKSACEAVIKEITDSPLTGKTVTASIGDNYTVQYGQLSNLKVKVGDKVKEGDSIGTIAKPSKSFSLEGSNLYFKVLEKDQAVNPLLFLR